MSDAPLYIQWYPGHMTKTRRMMQQKLSMVDLVLHVLDARIVRSSMNPDFETLFENKPRIFLINKCDMASPNITNEWLSFFKAKGLCAIAADCVSGKGLQQVEPLAKKLLAEKIEKAKEKGMNRKIRVMITGVPNVGKSTLINRLAGRKVALAQDRPGVTRAAQWVNLTSGMELMDTPGMLWPKFEDQRTGMFLAFTGAIRDEILDREELALEFVRFMQQNFPDGLVARYKLSLPMDAATPLEVYEEICKNRGCIISRGDYDYERAASIILDEYRAGKLGKISFERP